MPSITLSIITPSFNQASFIEETIQSVLSQNVDVEYVIFDGGSTDGTLEILQKYSSKLRWYSEADRGQTHAVNKGILATKGDIIGWLNSDDIYLPDTLELVRNFFTEHPKVDVLYGDAWHIDIDGNPYEKYPTEVWSFERLKNVCFLSQPAVFFRRSVVDRFGLLNETLQYCMDYEYWLRLGANGAKFAYLPHLLAGSRMYADNKTQSQRYAVHEEIANMMSDLLGKVPDRWLFNFAHVLVEKKGLSREKTPSRFILEVSLYSIGNAWRWNKSISKDMLATILRWNFNRLR